MLAECSIDVCLVAATITSVRLEPGDDVRVDPQRNLLLHRPVEDSAPGIGPVKNLRGISCVDLVVGQSLQRPYLRLNVCRQLSHVLLDRPSLMSHRLACRHDTPAPRVEIRPSVGHQHNLGPHHANGSPRLPLSSLLADRTS